MHVHGDPTRRGADHGEAYGASIKSEIHNRCLRRVKSVKPTEHVKRDAAGNVIKRWTQKGLGVSRIAQVWRNQATRERLLAEAESEAYVQRSHCRLSSTGFASGGHAAAASRRKSGVTPIAEKVKVARMNA